MTGQYPLNTVLLEILVSSLMSLYLLVGSCQQNLSDSEIFYFLDLLTNQRNILFHTN